MRETKELAGLKVLYVALVVTVKVELGDVVWTAGQLAVSCLKEQYVAAFARLDQSPKRNSELYCGLQIYDYIYIYIYMHITIITMMMMIIIINIQCSIYIYIIYMYTNILSQSSTIGYNMISYAFFYVICMIIDSSACQAAEEFIAVLKRRCSSCLRSSTLCVEDWFSDQLINSFINYQV